MKYRCDHCNEYHGIGDLTINIGSEGHQVIEDIGKAVTGIIEKRGVPYELLIYTLAANLEQTILITSGLHIILGMENLKRENLLILG